MKFFILMAFLSVSSFAEGEKCNRGGATNCYCEAPVGLDWVKKNDCAAAQCPGNCEYKCLEFAYRNVNGRLRGELVGTFTHLTPCSRTVDCNCPQTIRPFPLTVCYLRTNCVQECDSFCLWRNDVTQEHEFTPCFFD